MLGEQVSVLVAIGKIVGVLAALLLIRCLYDVFLHPLRNFPGPKIAGIWSFYEFYYDVIKDGTYLWEIEKMHKKYGPIVRINSKSLHIHDPDAFSIIYAGGGRRVDKESSSVNGYTFPHSTISTIGHDLHRKRRAILNPYFSKRAVVALEPLIHERLDTLCARLESFVSSASAYYPINLTSVFSAFTADVTTTYFYGSCPDYLGSRDMSFGLKDALTALLDYYHLTRFLPLPATWLKNLPLPVLRLLHPHFPLVLAAREHNISKISSSISGDEDLKIDHLADPKSDQHAGFTKSRSVIVSALADVGVPAADKTMDRLADEGETIIFAGIDTTARTLAVAWFHLLNNKMLLSRLRQCLESAPRQHDGPWTTAELESLPFVRGIVQESIRLTYGLVVRIPRVCPDEPIHYKGFEIPPGTPVSQSTYMVNNDPTNFPNPQIFDPERWIRAANEGYNLDKYMVSFSKGTRGCLGINLAYSMLYLGIARMATRLDMELFDTTQADIEVHHTRGFAFPKSGPGCVQVTCTGVRI